MKKRLSIITCVINLILFLLASAACVVLVLSSLKLINFSDGIVYEFILKCRDYSIYISSAFLVAFYIFLIFAFIGLKKSTDIEKYGASKGLFIILCVVQVVCIGLLATYLGLYGNVNNMIMLCAFIAVFAICFVLLVFDLAKQNKDYTLYVTTKQDDIVEEQKPVEEPKTLSPKQPPKPDLFEVNPSQMDFAPQTEEQEEPAEVAPENLSMEEQLARYISMRDSGQITAEQFEQFKKDLIKRQISGM